MADEIVVEGGGTPAAPVAPPVAVAPVAPITPAPAQATGGVDWEKQRTGLTADLAKERKQRQALEAQTAQFQSELAAERKRIQALVGVTPLNPEETEAAEIRARFGKVFTKEQLLEQMGLSPEDIEDIRAAREERASTKATSDHYWTQHAQNMVNGAIEEIAKSYGGTLSEKQKATITRAYVLRAREDPAFLERHDQSDKTLAAEFAKEWIDEWFEPAKRSALATEVGQYRRVPNGQNRGIVSQGDKKIDVKDPKAVEDLLVAGFKERGGQFGRR
jgi:hypothetical protein